MLNKRILREELPLHPFCIGKEVPFERHFVCVRTGVCVNMCMCVLALGYHHYQTQ